MTIKSFDKANLKQLRVEIDAALAEVAKRNGITLDLGNIRFRNTTFSARITADIPSADPTITLAEDPQERKWRKGLASYEATVAGLAPKDAGRTFTLYDEKYDIIGFRPKAKMQVVARKVGRKSYIALSTIQVLPALEEVA